ncbi:RNA recognition motif domain-containing protein [Prosthecobacter sp.]|uniref:RNA recognition motif domain-containing protein n=1 Tax=Prosthecobacter sp. TaxID=1965333 RepID=UPI00378487F8
MSDYPNRNGGGNNGNRRNRNRNRSRGPRPEGPRPTREGGRESRNAPSFFQKILGFFGLGQKSKSRPQTSSPAASGPRSTNDNPRPMREPREAREPREPRPRREAPPAVNPADITTDRLYVGNLSYDATESDLFELFNGVGAVKNAEVVVNSRTQRSKGFAFVTMGSVEEARRAVQELSGKDFMGRPLQLSGAKPNTRGEDSGAPSEEAAQAA